MSPIWDSTDGFGGNGNTSAGGLSSLDPDFTGNCVENGPFAGLEVLYVGPNYKPHCLARNFEKTTKIHEMGSSLKPENLAKLFEESDYSSFNLGVEHGPHLTIPFSIRGDFSFFTAPNGITQDFSLRSHANSLI